MKTFQEFINESAKESKSVIDYIKKSDGVSRINKKNGSIVFYVEKNGDIFAKNLKKKFDTEKHNYTVRFDATNTYSMAPNAGRMMVVWQIPAKDRNLT